MRRLLLLISIACLTTLLAPSALAQDASFPQKEGDRCRYSVQIDFGKAYISGIGMFAYTDNMIAASVFNEFGVSALSFSYNPQKDKVKILNLAGKLNRWYIKYVLKKDLKKVIKILQEGGTSYKNQKYDITYTFTPLVIQDEITE
jgi:hypothetical protein